jgi:2-dehydro-3-deoxygalactonokinase
MADLQQRCVLYIDGGTTQTRVWAVHDGHPVAQARATVGARDTARDGSSARLLEAVRDLVARVAAEAVLLGRPAPRLAVAAGMITSPQGLCEVPHAEAPAGFEALAAGAVLRVYPEIPLPVLFVPGVRSGPTRATAADILAADVMRGEEVLALGLAADDRVSPGGIVLNLGSHWKAIRLDAQGRIAGSVTTLSGELIHAVQTQTILASALPEGRPRTLDPDWLDAGATAAQREGLPRALFAVRLLDQRATCSPEQRQAFLIGAVMAADQRALIPAETVGARVAVVGADALAQAWTERLRRSGLKADALDEATVERAFWRGCAGVLSAANLDQEL